MAKRPTVTTVSSGYYGRIALNNNFTELRDGFDNTLSLDGSTPNAMLADLDLNSNDIVNAGSITASNITVAGTSLASQLAIAAASATSSANSATASASSATQAQASESAAALSAASAALTASGLTGFDLTAIDEAIAGTAVDVFVYKTSDDSDGGAWRNRTQNKSWYNETLNTATRGSRREFPSVALIVATASAVTIYDADDPALPMWRVFTVGAFPNFALITQGTPTSVAALNGKICVGGDSTSDGRIFILDMPRDDIRYSSNTVSGLSIGIANSNGSAAVVQVSTDLHLGRIVAARVNDVAMTALSGAPIDAATGLGVPTIAVATDGGVSVINNDGTVADSSSGSAKAFVAFDGPTLYFCNDTNGATWVTDSYATDGFGATVTYNVTGTAEKQITFPNVTALEVEALGSLEGLTLLDTAATQSQSMHCDITDTYNTGWMQGDIKGALLSSTDTSSLVDTALNSTTDYTAEWSQTEDGWTINATSLVCDGVDAAEFVFIGPLTGTLLGEFVLGDQVAIKIEVSGYSSGTLKVDVGNGGSDTIITATGNGTYVATGALSSNTRIFVKSENFDGTISGIEISKPDADRSVNDNPLVINGTITRAAVATGAELVGYSGWSASNYLEQPYNADLDFGTGDFYIAGWVSDLNNSGVLLDRRSASGASFYVYTSGGALSAAAGAGVVTGSANLEGLEYNMVHVVRRSGVLEIYINGDLDNSGAAAASVTDTDAVLTIGERLILSSAPMTTGKFSLLRIGAGAPTAAQIKKIYEDEKYLFQENADATLTNSTVAAMDFDPDTNLLHVGGDVGRDEFQGLRRTATTAGAVTAAISAKNNLVASE